jgi:hypothetical protein
MFLDYISSVVATYRKKAESGMLSIRLAHPTPANLKKECIAVCVERFKRGDELMLRTFFGRGDDKEECLKAIEKCDHDKFRPLINFLKGRTVDTSDVNIELLAWLIDFTPRPFQHGLSYASNYEPPTRTVIDAPEPEFYEGDVSVNSKKVSKYKQPNWVLGDAEGTRFGTKDILRIIILLLFVLLIGFAGYKFGGFGNRASRGCMYWTGDFYKEIPCDQKPQNAFVIQLNPERLQNFKRITTPDTITNNSVGKIWYRIKKGNYEFYTSGGYHPIDIQVQLRRLTDHSIAEYRSKKTP